MLKRARSGKTNKDLTSIIIDEAVKLLSPTSYERTQIWNLPQSIRQAGSCKFTSMSQAAGWPSRPRGISLHMAAHEKK